MENFHGVHILFGVTILCQNNHLIVNAIKKRSYRLNTTFKNGQWSKVFE